MSSFYQEISESQLVSIRNNLAHIYRFGGVCADLKFNPTNISPLESKTISSSITNSLNEKFWNAGIDIISTNYNNGAAGFMLVTTTENKDAIKAVLGNLDISKTLKNEYVVMAEDIFGLSGQTNDSLQSISYTMTIYDTYKINTQNQFSISLNEEGNTSSEVVISERALRDHFRSLGLAQEDTSGIMDTVSQYTSKANLFVQENYKTLVLVAALMYVIVTLVNRYNSPATDSVEYSAAKNVDVDAENNEKVGEAFVDDLEGAEPGEPGEPGEPSDYEVTLSARTISNKKVSSLTSAIDADDKNANIQEKILALLCETSTSD